MRICVGKYCYHHICKPTSLSIDVLFWQTRRSAPTFLPYSEGSYNDQLLKIQDQNHKYELMAVENIVDSF
jgi:hypothetical protein